MPSPRLLAIAPCDLAAAHRLERALGVAPVVAQVLVRRGLCEVEEARAWLRADEAHPPEAFAGMAQAVDVVLGHVGAGGRITVHGDYDVDGVSATAILVRTLRLLGADVDWFLPSRTEDGYGLSGRTVERLAARGTRLLLTADCAVTAVDEVAAARAAGWATWTRRARGCAPTRPTRPRPSRAWPTRWASSCATCARARGSPCTATTTWTA